MAGSDRQAISVTYLTGDATAPIGKGHKIIVHVCNDIGKWGKGFVLAISRRWKAPETQYRAAFAKADKPVLGDVQFVPVDKDITVANLIGQYGVARSSSKTAPVRYDAIRQGLEKIATFAKKHHASVHMPRIGCGLAGGSWDRIEPLINDTLIKEHINTNVYDFDESHGPKK